MSLKYFLITMLFYIFRLFPIKNNKVVISSYMGKGYGDNAKYICEEIKRRNLPLDVVWLLQNKNEFGFPEFVRKVKIGSVKSVYELVTARVWIDNMRKKSYVRKRKGQFYIQTWHGGIGPKRIEQEIEGSLPAWYVKGAKNDSKMMDLLLAESSWTYEHYRKAFWYSGEIAKCGVPREDLFYDKSNKLVSVIRERLNIRNNDRVVLFVPTYRENISDYSVYKLEWINVLESLSKRFGGNWKGMIRLHPNVSFLAGFFESGENIIDVTSYPDIQELLLISDFVISDYSSVIYEYSLLFKPAAIFAPDYVEYTSSRDLAIDYSELPFIVSYSTDELINSIESFDEEKYLMKLSEFHRQYLDVYEGGHASSYVVDRIADVVNLYS